VLEFTEFVLERRQGSVLFDRVYNGEVRCPESRSYGVPGRNERSLKTGILFPLTVLPCTPIKGSVASPLNCRVKSPSNKPGKENNHFNPYFV
jgi:hypothetical protein